MGLALLGALVITPDTLLIRLSELEGWSLTTWRGLLCGMTLLFIWSQLAQGRFREDLEQIKSIPFGIICISVALSNVTFNFAVVETSVTVVLTALATAPILAAGLSFFLLKEITSLNTWITIILTLCGVFIVILNGDSATAAPLGNIYFGGFLGLICAFCHAIVFVSTRKYTTLPILLAVALGNILSGIIGLISSSTDALFNGLLWPVLLMGFGVMPIAMAMLSLAPRYTAATNVSLFMLLELVLGPFWVWLGTDEQPSPMMIGGAALVLITLLFYFLTSSKHEVYTRDH